MKNIDIHTKYILIYLAKSTKEIFLLIWYKGVHYMVQILFYISKWWNKFQMKLNFIFFFMSCSRRTQRLTYDIIYCWNISGIAFILVRKWRYKSKSEFNLTAIIFVIEWHIKLRSGLLKLKSPRKITNENVVML